MWDSKVAAANKAWDDQVKAVADSAEAALDAGISKVSQVVRRCAAGAAPHCSWVRLHCGVAANPLLPAS